MEDWEFIALDTCTSNIRLSAIFGINDFGSDGEGGKKEASLSQPIQNNGI